MIRVTLRNITDMGLPLNNGSKIMDDGATSEQVIKQLEKKYHLKTYKLCYKSCGQRYVIYTNPAYRLIDPKDKFKWVTNYEIYVRSSFQYKLWILVNQLFHH